MQFATPEGEGRIASKTLSPIVLASLEWQFLQPLRSWKKNLPFLRCKKGIFCWKTFPKNFHCPYPPSLGAEGIISKDFRLPSLCRSKPTNSQPKLFNRSKNTDKLLVMFLGALLTSRMEPWNKSLNFIFPTKYVIPKSLKFSHWPSKITNPNSVLSVLLLMGRIPVNSPVEVGGLSHYLQGFMHPKWCRFSEPSTVLQREISLKTTIFLHQVSSIKNGERKKRPFVRLHQLSFCGC